MYLHVIQGIKYILLFIIFLLSTAIGMSIAKTYENRVKELKEFKNILNMIKTKIIHLQREKTEKSLIFIGKKAFTDVIFCIQTSQL